MTTKAEQLIEQYIAETRTSTVVSISQALSAEPLSRAGDKYLWESPLSYSETRGVVERALGRGWEINHEQNGLVEFASLDAPKTEYCVVEGNSRRAQVHLRTGMFG